MLQRSQAQPYLTLLTTADTFSVRCSMFMDSLGMSLPSMLGIDAVLGALQDTDGKSAKDLTTSEGVLELLADPVKAKTF